MKINVKKLVKQKVGTTSTHKLDEEVTITDTVTAPVTGQVTLTKENANITAHFDITVNVNIHWTEEDQATSRHQIPLNFKREYLLEAKEDDDQVLALTDHSLNTDDAIVPEAKVNLPVQSFKENNTEEKK